MAFHHSKRGRRLALVAGLGIATMAYASPPPTQAKIDFAVRTSDLMLATMFAALTQEFDETTPQNVEEGKKSISLIFNDQNRDMRLVGMDQPLQANDMPLDDFEEDALAAALETGTALTRVEKVKGKWYYRRSIPLSNFRAECAMCHSNFPAGPTPDRVGALMLRVPTD
jgi:hypothetical protein